METAWPNGYDRVVLDEVDSTMEEAARRASDISRPTWILALRQTAARGRMGRVWTHPDGNFAASLVMPVDEPIKIASWRTFLAAVALAETLRRFGIESDRVLTKWPNDVLLDGGKVAGILLETELSGDHVRRVTTGIGVNLSAAPPAEARAAFPPVSVAQATGLRITPEQFLDCLAGVMAAWEDRFRAESYYPVRTAWEKSVAHKNEITIRTTKRKVTGLFVDLDEQGRLVIHNEKGLHHFPAGDISFTL